MKKKTTTTTTIIILFMACAVIVFLLHLFFPYQFQSPAPEVWYDAHGQVLIGHKQEQYSSLEEVPQRVIDLVVAIEDERFRSHRGIDIRSIARAFWNNTMSTGTTQGASTIDQQLIKLDRQQFARGWGAKIIENREALHLQLHYTKEAILLRYVNAMPFSHSIVGWKSACESYRNKACVYLSDEQLLITLVTAQLGANPYRADDWQKILGRAQMYTRVRPELFSGSVIVTDALAEELYSFPAPLDPRVRAFVRTQDAPGQTAYDLALSQRIDRILAMTRMQRDQYRIRDCCVVVLDGDGALVSMNVCRDREDPESGKINSCLVPRQTGSAIKPFLYLYAFKQLRLSSTDMIIDEPVQFDLGGGNLYDPKNFDLDYHGEVTYAYALGNSLNVPAIKTLHDVGVAPFLQFLQEHLSRVTPAVPLNPKTADEVGLSLALGTYELSPWQFAQLWRLFLPKMSPPGYDRQRQEIVAILSDPQHKVVSFGQDNFLSPRGWATKTGTSRKFVDGWICGVHVVADRTVCLRLGNQTNASMLGASSEVGSYLWSLIVEAMGG